jgi:DNA mismatch repair protein MutS2
LIHTETLTLLEWHRLCQHLSTFAATKLGAIASRHLKLPSTKAQSLELLAQTKEIYALEQRLDSNWKFEGIKDIGEYLDRAKIGGMLEAKELLEVATTLSGVRNLRRIIDAQEELDLSTLKALVENLRTYPEIEKDIHYCIDDRGDVTERASPKLADIRSQIKKLRDRIYQILQGIIQRQSGALQEAVITQRGDRFVLPVKAPQKDNIPGIVHDLSSTGATLYIEPKAIVDLGNKLRQAIRQERREEEAILIALTEKIAAAYEDLEQLLAIATALDLATARARYGLWLEANPPRFVDFEAGETVTLRKLRHPLLVWQNKHEQGMEVVPIDVYLKQPIKVVAITGPNTGGKTVTLKTIGLAALMAKAGLFIPAREPVEIPWFDEVLADIGDEQSIEQSLSTFSGHIRRIGRIIDSLGGRVASRRESEVGSRESEIVGEAVVARKPRHLVRRANGHSQGADSEVSSEYKAPPVRELENDSEKQNVGVVPCAYPENAEEVVPSISPDTNVNKSQSLVLLDEVGAGTDPAEGSALAIALLKYLATNAQITIATTHYGELKALKYQDERFENASVEFNDNTLQPTYRLLWGIPGRSNALTIARRLGLKEEIVDDAKNRVGEEYAEDINQVISALEAERRQQEAKAKEASKLLEQTERFYAEVSEKASSLQEREKDLKLYQEKAVQQAIADAKADIAKVIRQLQQGEATAQKAQKATESLNRIAETQIRQEKPKVAKPGYQPKVGEKVRIPSLGQTAEVLTLADEEGELFVRFGLMKMKVSLAEVESLDGKKAEMPIKQKAAPAATPQPAKSQPPVTVRTSQNTVDLRGSRVANAESDLERAIAQATASGVLWIIHGKGTGKLREGVHEFLKLHPQIDRFELAPQNEGGSGVTVAYLI